VRLKVWGRHLTSERDSSYRQKRGSSEKIWQFKLHCAEDHTSSSPRGCTQEAKVQSQGCFHVFHGSFPGHLIEKILNLQLLMFKDVHMFLNPFSLSLLDINMNGSIVHFNKIRLKNSHSEPQKGVLGGGLSLKRKVMMFNV